jgi:elongation factor P
MYEASNLRKGLKIQIDGQPYLVTQFSFVKPGKGQALYKCKLKNMVDGTQFDKTFRSGDKIDAPSLEEQEMEYLYYDGQAYCFMNTSTYAQELLTADQIGDATDFLKENTVCQVLFHDGKPIGLTLPNFMELQVTEAEPWAKGDTAAGSTKPATLETGYVLQVPPFINEGEMIRVDTRTGEYVERVKG